MHVVPKLTQPPGDDGREGPHGPGRGPAGGHGPEARAAPEVRRHAWSIKPTQRRRHAHILNTRPQPPPTTAPRRWRRPLRRPRTRPRPPPPPSRPPPGASSPSSSGAAGTRGGRRRWRSGRSRRAPRTSSASSSRTAPTHSRGTTRASRRSWCVRVDGETTDRMLRPHHRGPHTHTPRPRPNPTPFQTLKQNPPQEMARYHVPPPPRAPSSPLLRLLPLGYYPYAAAAAPGPFGGAFPTTANTTTANSMQDLSHPVLVRMRQLLLTHAGVRGAVDVRDAFGRTALFIAVGGGCLWVALAGGRGCLVLCWSCRRRQTQADSLLSRPTNPTQQPNQQADGLNAEAARILLQEGGADPTIPNNRGVAPLDLLTGRGRAHLRILPSYWPVLRLLEVRGCRWGVPRDGWVIGSLMDGPSIRWAQHKPNHQSPHQQYTERPRRARPPAAPPQGPRAGRRGLRARARGGRGHGQGEQRSPASQASRAAAPRCSRAENREP